MVTTSLKLVIFGLSISSSWGNGHATLWRGLCRALGKRGHRVVFFEKDVPYYASTRDMTEIPGCELRLYDDVGRRRCRTPRRELADADVGMVTSYCPDGPAASRSRSRLRRRASTASTIWIHQSRSHGWSQGERVDYLPADGPRRLRCGAQLHRRRGAATGSRHSWRHGVSRRFTAVSIRRFISPPKPCPSLRPILSYLGTYAADRQDALERLFIEPARIAAEPQIRDRRRAISERFPVDQQHLLRPASSAGAASGLLLLVPHDAERHAPGDGGHGLLPVGPAVRSCGMRRSDA